MHTILEVQHNVDDMMNQLHRLALNMALALA